MSTVVAAVLVYVVYVAVVLSLWRWKRVGMVLHAAWDFATLGLSATGRTPTPAQLGLTVLTYVAALAAVWPVVSG